MDGRDRMDRRYGANFLGEGGMQLMEGSVTQRLHVSREPAGTGRNTINNNQVWELPNFDPVFTHLD